jgi:tetratricopeptide (TPR) repeat protein
MTTAHVPRKRRPISSGMLSALRADIDSRRIEHGMNLLTNMTCIIDSFDPSVENAAAFLGILAEWSDLGFGNLDSVKRLIASYDVQRRSKLPIYEYIPLRMAEGMVAMTEEMFDRAIDHFSIVLKLAEEVSAWDILAIVNYWTARCERKKGQHENALIRVRKAREVQSAHGHIQNEVPARMLESLILFENGNSKQALSGLREAEVILSQTDDYLTRGNIQSTYGHFFERELRFGQAIEHYMHAIQQFRKGESEGVHVARTIVDMSFARIQMARRLRQSIEGYPDQRRDEPQTPPRASFLKELSGLYVIIVKDLDYAAGIYTRSPNPRGTARVHLYRGYLYLDMGKLDFAAQEAGLAYFAAESKHDFILMASGRNLQCMIENARVEDEIEGWTEHAVASQDYARDAVELASNTQNRRLLAAVYTWYGLTFSNGFFGAQDRMRDSAREAMDKAALYLEPGVRDYIWEDFQVLKRRLSESTTLAPKLMQWAHGEVGEKTFRQLEEDFADLVIPKMWEQENRKISRVASRLSISPRKVRRVLTRLGLMEAECRPDNVRVKSTASANPREAWTEKRKIKSRHTGHRSG